VWRPPPELLYECSLALVFLSSLQQVFLRSFLMQQCPHLWLLHPVCVIWCLPLSGVFTLCFRRIIGRSIWVWLCVLRLLHRWHGWDKLNCWNKNLPRRGANSRNEIKEGESTLNTEG
jgi:hypothetical protein